MEFKRINDFEWELEAVEGMNVPGKIFASEELFNQIKKGRSISQIQNVARLPGILKSSIAMPDAHQGYGFSIGGVAAFDIDTGVISPGGVGYDINCSVRLLKTNLVRSDLEGREREIVKSLFKAVPSGVGKRGKFSLKRNELDEILITGASWMVEKGFGTMQDLEFIEENGCMVGADSADVSERSKERGINQMGTLGAGNHFLDVLIVDEIFDSKTAKVYGLKKNQVVIMIHCGSRGLGHQVASDYIRLMEKKYGYPEFDRGLVNAPITSKLGKKYYSAMACAANFAFANKQLITYYIREDLKKFFPDFEAEVVYDICHNIAKFEMHIVDGKEKELLIMRKGATRSFGPDRKEIPKKYSMVGQPIFIPGSMGTASYVLAGTNKSEKLSFASTAHGAGRIKSRTEIRNELDYETAKRKMEELGIYVESGSHKGMIEESPDSYKDIEEVVRVSDGVGIGRKVVRLMPLLVVVG
jgi:tRNA-splicing ligase RtcB